jgi:hypothetical protein
MGSHDPFGHLKYKFCQKKGKESNCQFDSQPLKVENRPDFLACKWHGIYHWKDLDEGYNFALNFTSIGCLHTKLWFSKVVRVPWQNDIWVMVPWPCIENTIRGKVVASPSPNCGESCEFVFAFAPKMLQLCINQLVVWFV